MPSNLAEIRQVLRQVPAIDVHSHLGQYGFPQARTLADLVAYHWLSLGLMRAGAELAYDDRWLSREFAQANPDGFMIRALPYFPAIAHTGIHFCLMAILRDLYGCHDRTITLDNWRALDERIRASSEDRWWFDQVLDRSRVTRVLLPASYDLYGDPDRILHFAFADYLVSPQADSYLVPRFGPDCSRPRNAGQLDEFIGAELEAMIRRFRVGALHVRLAGDDLFYEPNHPAERVDDCLAALSQGQALTPAQNRCLVSQALDLLAAAAACSNMVVQIFYGLGDWRDLVPRSFTSSSNPRLLHSLGRLAYQHPRTQFDMFMATHERSREAASVARTSRNISISGAFGQAFSAGTLDVFYRDRFDLLPLNAWSAFSSDAYCVEWVYGKLALVRDRLARVLTDLEDERFITFDEIPRIAEQVLHHNAQMRYFA